MQPVHRRLALIGPAYMLGSALLFSILGLLIKIIGPEYRLWDIAVYRLLGGGIVLYAIFGWKQNLFKPVYPKLMLIRGLTGTLAFFCLVVSIRSIPFSTAMAIFYSFPAFAAVFSPTPLTPGILSDLSPTRALKSTT